MRSTLLAIILVLPVLGIANALFFGMQVRAFLNRVRAIRGPREIEAFKAMVKRQMIAALVQIPLLALPGVVYAYGVYSGELPLSDIVWVLLPAALVVGLAQLVIKPWEVRARELPVEDPVLRRERDRVVACWLKKPLPDW